MIVKERLEATNMKVVVRVYCRGVEATREMEEASQAFRIPLEAPVELRNEMFGKCVNGRKVAALKWLISWSLVS